MMTFPLAPDRAARLLLRACVRAGRMRFLYDPEQARDEFGKWTSGGGSHVGQDPEEDYEGKAPDVDWYARDLQDSSRNVSAETVRRDYANNADVDVYRAMIDINDLDEKLVEEEDQEKHEREMRDYESALEDYDPDDPDAEEPVQPDEPGGYNWSELQRGRGTPPPAKVEVRAADNRAGYTVTVIDGNHRIRFWRENNYDLVPAWVVDYRKPVKKIRSAAFDSDQPRDDQGQWTSGSSAFGTTDKFVYHISSTSIPLSSYQRSGIRPSKTGLGGPGVYMANKPEATQYYEELGKGRLFRIDKDKLIERFGKYPENKEGVEYDESTGEVVLSGSRSIPREFIEVKIGNKWRALQSLRGAAFDPDQPRDESGKWTSFGGFLMKSDEQGQWTDAGSAYAKDVGTRLNVVTDGKVDGRIIPDFDDKFGPDVPNVSSISASLTDYDVLDGIREVPLSEFTGNDKPSFYSVTEEKRVNALAERIRESGTITPLIVVYDGDPRGPYVLEGGHRFDALLLLGAKSMPAMVVIDNEKFRAAEFDPNQERDERGRWTDGDGSITPAMKELVDRLGTTDYWYATQFLLPDGTRVRGDGRHHVKLAGGTEKMNALMKEGAIRYVPNAGVSVSAPLTETQARIIADDWNTHRDVSTFSVDVGWDENLIDSKSFTTPVTADAIRNFVRRTLTEKSRHAMSEAVLRWAAFNPGQARDESGKWTAGAGSDQSWTKEDRGQASLNDIPFQEDPAPDFSRSVDKTIAEPPFPDLPKGKHAAAGVVVTEPDGRVWMVQPYGKYGGYKNTFPKGTIDPSEDPQETAAREVWEETGLVVKITGHLADVERSTSVTRFYEGRRIGGAPWSHGKETYAVRLMPIEGKKIEGALKSVRGSHTADHRVLDALRQSRASRLLAEFDEAKHPRDEAGRWTDTDGDWPKGLTNISGAKGTNPGGLYKDSSGQKWYVKRYNDPRQAATEHIANEVYRAVGVDAPHSVLGEGGDYASKWMPSDGTLAQEGITRERADRILDGFAADVFLDNWDAVGTGHDNILVKGDQVTRIDQGGTLIFRAQGALKPESGLEKIDEWESLVKKNHYYAQIFKKAGIKDGDALGERAAKQIDRIVKARPAGGWKELVDRVAPKADTSFRAKVAKMLEARQKGLERKRDELRGRAAEMRALHLPGEHEQQSHAGGTGGVGEKKKKAPKAPPVPLESKKAAYDEVKKGATFKATAKKYGMTQGQLSGYVWKIDQAKKKVEEGLQEQQAAETVVKAPEAPPEKPWAEMSSDERLTYAHEQGYAWKPKPESKSGNYAWYDKEGHQVSGFGPKESYREKLETINYGAGIVPKVPDVPAPTGVWPISNDIERQMSDGYANKVAKAHTPWSKTLTHDERVAIEGYTGSAYQHLNEVLREGGGLSSFHAGISSKLNSAIDKAPKPPPPELIWRGISSDNAAKIFGGLKNGDTLVMKGFQSSTIRPAFANSWGGGKIIFEIKPSRGAYVKLLSSHPHEYEYLLPHNAKYTVRGVTHVKFQGVGSPVRVLQLEMH